jgi:GTP pyrophosphokinase
LQAPITHPRGEQIEALVAAYATHEAQVTLFRDQLVLALQSSAALNRHIHSIRSRIKEAAHLRDKLYRKADRLKAAGQSFDIEPGNLLVRVNDLVGVRILHLHTRQIREIDAALRDVFSESQYELLEGPKARTWDDESRAFFKECGIDTVESASLYTSVHYVIGSASRTRVTAELQVRTLMEEVWGEVDHTLNYPLPCSSVGCREQLKVLARVTSSATRLVDAIFITADAEVSHRATSPPLVAATAASESATSVGARPLRRRPGKRLPRK